MSKQTPDNEWHEIATAPKDGTAILLFCPDAPEGTRRGVESKIVVGEYRGRSWDDNGYWVCDVMEVDCDTMKGTSIYRPLKSSHPIGCRCRPNLESRP